MIHKQYPQSPLIMYPNKGTHSCTLNAVITHWKPDATVMSIALGADWEQQVRMGVVEEGIP